MPTVRQIINSSEFSRNVITLLGGATLAQAIPFVISPILSRIYTPYDLGIFALYTGIIGLIAPLATWAYEQAVMLPEDDQKAWNVVMLTVLVSIIASSISLIFFILFNKPISKLLNNPDISPWLYFVPLAILVNGIFQVLSFWYLRRKRYRSISTSKIIQTLTSSIINLGMGFEHFGAGGLILGNLFGQTLGVFLLGSPILKEGTLRNNKILMKSIFEQAKEYDDFPKFNLPQLFLDGFRESGLIFLISLYFGATSLGSYSFVLRVLKLPLSLIGSAFAQVFYQRASQAYNQKQSLWPLLKGVLLRLVIIGLPIFIISVIFGPKLFVIVFGNKWIESGVYARYLSPWILLGFIGSPISQIPIILRKQKQFLLIGIGFNFLIPTTFFVIANLVNNIDFVLMILSLVATIYLIGSIAWVIQITRNSNYSTSQLESQIVTKF